MVSCRSYGDTSVKLNFEERSSLLCFSRAVQLAVLQAEALAGFNYSPFEIIFHGATSADVRVLSKVLISV